MHLTLNTGHVRVSPRDEVAMDIIDILRPRVRAGKHPVPGRDGYTLDIATASGGLMATVYAADERPLVSFAVAADDESAAKLWEELERLYYAVTEMPGHRSADWAVPERPSETPWCAALTICAAPEEAYWIADLERCVAWTWIDRLK